VKSRRFGDLYRAAPPWSASSRTSSIGTDSARFAFAALARVQLHADLTMLARLSQALARARAIPLAA
jgi:hypothetical protein